MRKLAAFSRNTEVLKRNSLFRINKTNILFKPIRGDMFSSCFCVNLYKYKYTTLMEWHRVLQLPIASALGRYLALSNASLIEYCSFTV
jgi:hypothetical protein